MPVILSEAKDLPTYPRSIDSRTTAEILSFAQDDAFRNPENLYTLSADGPAIAR